MMYSGCSYPSPFQLHQSVSIWMSARLKQHVVVELWLYRAVLGSLVVAAGTGMSSARCLKEGCFGLKALGWLSAWCWLPPHICVPH